VHQSAKSGIRNVTPGQVAMLLSFLHHIEPVFAQALFSSQQNLAAEGPGGGRDIVLQPTFRDTIRFQCILPPAGALRITTEFGVMNVPPGQVAVVQRGMRFSVALHAGVARGYVLEVFAGHFTLPDLGPIGELSRDETLKCAQKCQK